MFKNRGYGFFTRKGKKLTIINCAKKKKDNQNLVKKKNVSRLGNFKSSIKITDQNYIKEEIQQVNQF